MHQTNDKITISPNAADKTKGPESVSAKGDDEEKDEKGRKNNEKGGNGAKKGEKVGKQGRPGNGKKQGRKGRYISFKSITKSEHFDG